MHSTKTLQAYSPSSRVLPVIVTAQFLCTSVWFAGNAVMPDIIRDFRLSPSFLSYLTSAVQLGFISGTLVFAILSLSDRFSPSRVFCLCSLGAALLNLGIVPEGAGAGGLIAFRFLTGFFLAGIYPVGMKIASDHYREGLGKSLGFLVGALVLGTAFPHLLRSLSAELPWRSVLYTTSILCAGGGLCLAVTVPDGPFRTRSSVFAWNGFLKGFRNKEFRAAAFGYFGHMWELYAFWAFVPVMLAAYGARHPEHPMNIPLASFAVIAPGGLACVAGGLLSQRFGAKKIAAQALAVSGLCCFSSPLFLLYAPLSWLLAFLVLWGMVVIADSPLFSTLVARHAPAEFKGASLTIVTCIGFAITVISIQLLDTLLSAANGQHIYMLLGLGPVMGLIALLRSRG